MLTEEDFLVEEEQHGPLPMDYTRDDARADRVKCRVCGIRKHQHKGTFCKVCWPKMATRHRSVQVLRMLWSGESE